MEFDPVELNKFILHLFQPTMTNNLSNDVCKTEPLEQTNTSVEQQENQQSPTNTNNNINNNNGTPNKRYCFIIFNNPVLSDLLNTRVFKGRPPVMFQFQFIYISLILNCFIE